MADHVADAEPSFFVVNITPDFCKVNKKLVPFEIFQLMSQEKASYSQDCYSRDQKVLTVGSVVGGTIGNMGEGMISGVSGAAGHAIALIGHPTVLVNDIPTVRHGDLFVMNTPD